MVHLVLPPALVRDDVEQDIHGGVRVVRRGPEQHGHTEDDGARADNAKHSELTVALRASVEIERVRARGGRVWRRGAVKDIVCRDVNKCVLACVREAREMLRHAGIQLCGMREGRETVAGWRRGVPAE